MTDMQKLADYIRSMGLNGVKVDVVNVNQTSDGKIDIGNILNNTQTSQAQGSKPTSQVQYSRPIPQVSQATVGIAGTPEAQKTIASKEKAKYKDTEGILIRFTDGSLMFQVDKENNGKKIRVVQNFNSEADFKKEKPYSQVWGKFATNGSGYIKAQEETYKYHRNGKVSQSELRDAKGIVLNTAEYDKKGRITQRLVNDTDGNLKFTFKFSYEKDGTKLSSKYDKDNNLIETAETKFNGEKPVSTDVKYPSGKIKSELRYDDNGKLSTKKDYYESGALKAEAEYYDNGVIKTQTSYDEDGNITGSITGEIDGEFGPSAQRSEGDCYLLSAINGLRESEEGRKILSNLVQESVNENGEKVYTVTFPGAQAAAESLKNDSRIDPSTVTISGTYTFTESEMQELVKEAGLKYSIGDGDVILLEAAFEKYRKEVKETLDANNLAPQPDTGEAGMQTGIDDNNILAGGFAEDAMYVLTGYKSKVYKNEKNTQGLDYEAMRNGELVVQPLPQKSGTSAVTVKASSEFDGPVVTDRDELDDMLDSIMADYNADGHIDNFATASFRVVRDDGTTGGHAFTIKAVTADTVVLVNPWYPDQEVTISREEFKQVASRVTIANPDAKDDNPQPFDNINNFYPGSRILNQFQQTQKPKGEIKIHGNYQVRQGQTYLGMIKEWLEEQGISPTSENIEKAKAQFETLNPGAVKTYHGRNKKFSGNKYLLAGATVKVPEFEM